jgi:hypothetical protein
MAKSKKITQKLSSKNPNNKHHLMPISSGALATPQQAEMDLRIEKQVERDGIDMGVLSDGTAFLSGRGLARLCGVYHSVMGEILADWNSMPQKPRIKKIKEILAGQGLIYKSPVIIAFELDQTQTYAWPDTVCLAVLEYYAFDAQQGNPKQARDNYRLLAGKALHDFIYTQVGYDPYHQIPEHWRVFHDRVSLTHSSIPEGYFCIFKEISDMVVYLGQKGVHIDSSFVTDISVGSIWGKHWTQHRLDNAYGTRIIFEHNYPQYFPQAKSNPQHLWCYPEMALSEFRRWLRKDYIGEGKFANYITNAVKKKELPPSIGQLAIAAYSQKGTQTPTNQ